jgi:hypothetical protein
MDPSSLSFPTSEEKKLKHNDKPGGWSLSPTTQEKPTSRFFSWVAKDNNEPKGSPSSFGFFCFFLELQKMTMNGEGRHCFLQCKKKIKNNGARLLLSSALVL